MRRKGLGKGTGKGYKNLMGSDKRIHSQSAKGVKQPQRINLIAKHGKYTSKRENLIEQGMQIENSEIMKLKLEYRKLLDKDIDDFSAGLENTTTKARMREIEERFRELEKPKTTPVAIAVQSNPELRPKYEDDFPEKPKPKKEKVNPYFNPTTILSQLGGNRFIAMTGAKNFVKDDKNQTIAFKIGRNSKGVNHVKIKLNVMDTYDMEFINIRAGKIKIKSEAKGVYNDQLQTVFTRETGLYTRL